MAVRALTRKRTGVKVQAEIGTKRAAGDQGVEPSVDGFFSFSPSSPLCLRFSLIYLA